MNIENSLSKLEKLGKKKNISFFESLRIKKILNFFLQTNNPEFLEQLRLTAVKTRNKTYQEKVFVRGLVEFSNLCCNFCKYCGLNIYNNKVTRYILDKGEILSQVEVLYTKGIKTVVLQSGEMENQTEKIEKGDIFRIEGVSNYAHGCNCAGAMGKGIALQFKEKYPDIAVTLSIGEKKFQDLKILKESGTDRYLLRIETTNRKLYSNLHRQKRILNTRIKTLKSLKKLRYQTGSGIMTGLPGQKTGDITKDLVFFKKNNFEMIGIGPFIPHPDTELKYAPRGRPELTLKVIALTRIILPYSLIPATTALGSLEKDYRVDALKWGANVLMPNFTPDILKARYEIYPGKESDSSLKNLELLAKKAGMILDFSRGDAPGF